MAGFLYPPELIRSLLCFMMRQKYEFGQFLKNNWWFFLIAFGHAFSNAKDSGLSNGSFLSNLLLAGGLIWVIMFIYWLLKYGRN